MTERMVAMAIDEPHDPLYLGYARLMDVDGEHKWVLFVDDGPTEIEGEGSSEPVYIAAYRQTLASYAHNHDIALLTVH